MTYSAVKGKVVIITGGGQGIGEFLALGLSKRRSRCLLY